MKIWKDAEPYWGADSRGRGGGVLGRKKKDACLHGTSLELHQLWEGTFVRSRLKVASFRGQKGGRKIFPGKRKEGA